MRYNTDRLIFYIYEHRHPITNECVYIGSGMGGRAWEAPKNRSENHSKWLDDVFDEGFDIDQVVKIIARRLVSTDARRMENELIRENSPKFNKTVRHPALKWSIDQYNEAVSLRNEGYSYANIADKIGLTAMTVFRGLTGQTISLENAIAEQ